MTVFLKPLVKKELTQYRDGYGNTRDWKNYNDSLKVSRFLSQPNPFQKSITFRALVESEFERDPNNSTGKITNIKRKDGTIRKVRKKTAKLRHIQYLVTIRFEDVTFSLVEPTEKQKAKLLPWKVANRTSYSNVLTIAKNPARLKCQCFTADTKIMLADGTSRPIGELVGQNVQVASWDERDKRFYSAKATNIRSYGFQKTMEVEVTGGHKIKCTPDHKFLLKTGEWVRADQLENGMSIESFENTNDLITKKQSQSLFNKIKYFFSKDKIVSAYKVVSAKNLKVEEVFCATVPQFGNFVVALSDDSGIVVKNCRDFMLTFEKQLADNNALWPTNVWTKYQRLTPAPPEGYPYRNPKDKMGYCKHIATLLSYLESQGYLVNK
jgi:hypothetical protein